MIAEEQNRRLIEVGRGTPAGELLRRYWHPVAATAELERERVLPVKLMGENLALFLTDAGDLGLVQERCPHRSASISCGIPDKDGIHCPYHGWYFDPNGTCLAQPYEDTVGTGTFKERIRITAYPARELGGLVFAYLGPLPAPELPRWDLLVRDDLVRSLQFTVLPCNYLQIMENSLDPVHFEWLHAQLANFMARKAGDVPKFIPRRHLKIEFDLYEYGIVKRRLLEGDAEDSEDWTVGHPVIFPTILAQGMNFQYRVPMDDNQTLHIYYNTRVRKEDEEPQATVPYSDLAFKNERGRYILDTVAGQDMMAWVSQGEVAPRPLENLGRSDRGVVMFRRMLLENIEKVQSGETPLGVIRDASVNEPMIKINREHAPLAAMRV
jgi:5,5'-dehydrodivanillate O-demethylase oxygenase subunit